MVRTSNWAPPGNVAKKTAFQTGTQKSRCMLVPWRLAPHWCFKIAKSGGKKNEKLTPNGSPVPTRATSQSWTWLVEAERMAATQLGKQRKLLRWTSLFNWTQGCITCSFYNTKKTAPGVSGFFRVWGFHVVKPLGFVDGVFFRRSLRSPKWMTKLTKKRQTKTDAERWSFQRDLSTKDASNVFQTLKGKSLRWEVCTL